jgi:hypothetical protein
LRLNYTRTLCQPKWNSYCDFPLSIVLDKTPTENSSHTANMSAKDITPPASGTATPTAKSLIKAGIEHNLASNAQTAQLDASKLKISLTSAPRDPPAAGSEELKKMRTCTDHMLTARWTLEDGWEAPEIKPYGPLSIMPTASVLHYATECFEGYVCEGTDTTSQKLRHR